MKTKSEELLKLCELWEKDQNQWVEEICSLVGKDYPDLETAGMIAALQEMSGAEKSTILSQTIRLIAHLLKVRYSSNKMTTSWETSIANARTEIYSAISTSPSLKNFANQKATEVTTYNKAKRWAERETKLKMPDTNPFTLEQIFDDDYYGE